MNSRLSSAAVFHLRRRSLLRANLLVVGSLIVAVFMSGFPEGRRNPLIAIPAILAFGGLFETIRCMNRRRWDFYHGGVLLCVYMDLMAISMILFFLFSPYVL